MSLDAPKNVITLSESKKRNIKGRRFKDSSNETEEKDKPKKINRGVNN